MAGQDWMDKDFYAILGVPKDADEATVKKAYRKRARELHPDHNPGDAKAEERFKDVSEAYSVLSDPEQRQQYDQIRTFAAGGARFNAPGGATGGFEDLFSTMFGSGGTGGAAGPGGAGGTRVRYESAGGFEDLLGGLFGGGGFRAPSRRGSDLEASTTLPFRQAAEGSTVTLSVAGRQVTARIPPGVHDGQKIRLRGKGHPGDGGGEPGDLVITVHVAPHPVFALDGRNVRITVPVTFDEAALGTELRVPTLDGSTVRLKVPAGTPSGRVLRARGKGITTSRGTGDLLVTVQVVVPQKLSKAARDAVKAFAAATDGEDVRAGLFEQAAT